MCGVSVCVHNHKSLASDSIKIVSRMNALVLHRGPDGEGIIQKENVTMGHRRLAIIDLTSNADQPMSLSNRYHLVFNGEIYNYLELKNELKGLGYKFQTKSDTEVILQGFSHFGTNIFQSLTECGA